MLKYGLGGAAALAIGGIGLGLQPSARVEPDGPLEALGVREYSVLVAVAEALFPGGDGLPTAREIGVARKVDAVIAGLHEGDRTELAQVLRLLENGVVGLLLDGRPVAFTRATLASRQRVLERWRTSRFTLRRTAYRALAGLCHAAYWSDPRLYAPVGYGGPPAWIANGR